MQPRHSSITFDYPGDHGEDDDIEYAPTGIVPDRENDGPPVEIDDTAKQRSCCARCCCCCCCCAGRKCRICFFLLTLIILGLSGAYIALRLTGKLPAFLQFGGGTVKPGNNGNEGTTGGDTAEEDGGANETETPATNGTEVMNPSVNETDHVDKEVGDANDALDDTSPNLEVSQRMVAMAGALGGAGVDVALLQESNTPQQKAFLWLSMDDARQLQPNDPDLSQRYALATLFHSTATLDATASFLKESGWLSGNHECEWSFTECADEVLYSSGEGDAGVIPETRQLLLPYGSLWGDEGGTEGRTLRSRVHGDKDDSYGNFFEGFRTDMDSKGENTFDQEADSVLGSMPSSLNADGLDMSNVTISPQIGETLSGTLVALRLAQRGLEGFLPDDISVLKSLELLDLNDNSLNGTIPEAFANMTKLKTLHLHGNMFTGGIPASLGSLVNLEQLTLDGNNLSGEVPDSLCNLSLTGFGTDFAESLPGVQCGCCEADGFISTELPILPENPLSVPGAVPISTEIPVTVPPENPPSLSNGSLKWSQAVAVFGEENGAEFGTSVSLSSRGNRLAVGSRSHGNSTGRVKVYEYYTRETGNLWEQVGFDIVGDAINDMAGYSVSLASDGNRVAVGSIGAGNVNGVASGHVRVYDYLDGEWYQVGETIEGENPGDQFGYSVALSGDGMTLAVGVPGRTNDNGGVYVLRYDGLAWNVLGDVMEGKLDGQKFGSSVSLSIDGDTVAAGAPETATDGVTDIGGYVRVFTFDQNWFQKGSEISSPQPDDQFGFSVSLSHNASVVAVGAPKYGGLYGIDRGSSTVFLYQGDEWIKRGEPIAGKADGDNAGYSVSLSGNGDILVIGMPGIDETTHTSSGHAEVYRFEGVWKSVGSSLDGKHPGDLAGFSVSMSHSGRAVALGSPMTKTAGRGYFQSFHLST